ncbi:MAG: hypothetical protein JNK60_04245 [Acidobacteria bacterium]|nr:hypothetical protein [Acidobacteriota bacterium]
MTRYRSVVVPVLAALVLAAPSTLFAATQCRVVGTVSDGEGKPLQGVKITITTPAITTYKLALETKAKGDWGTIINDGTLRYKLKFEKEGYGPVEQEKKFPIGETTVVDMKLYTAAQIQAQQGGDKTTVRETKADPFTAAYNESVEKFQAGDLAGAFAKAEECVALEPAKVQALDLATKVAFKAQNWAKVIEYGERALALDEDNPPLAGMLLEAYTKTGNKEKVKAFEAKFAAANPDKPEVMYNKAVELYNKNDFKGAEPLLKKVVAGKADFAQAHYLLGMCYVNLNNMPGMKTHLGEYLKLDPNGKDASTAKEMLDAFK